MIDAKVPLLAGNRIASAVGGLVGSLLFAGYMLMQFPGGQVGGRVGHRAVIVVGIAWAGIATILSGLMTALVGFVALRVITGLGAGVFYSNDRTVITRQSPFEKRSLGTGWGDHRPGGRHHARAAARVAADRPRQVGAGRRRRLARAVRRARRPARSRSRSGCRCSSAARAAITSISRSSGKVLGWASSRYAVVFLVAVMGIYVAATEAGLSEWVVAVLELVLALALVGFIFARLGAEVGLILRNRDLMIMNVSAIAILWNLWFFSFWSVSIVSDATSGGFLKVGADRDVLRRRGHHRLPRRRLPGRSREGLRPRPQAAPGRLLADPGPADVCSASISPAAATACGCSAACSS